MSSIPNESTAAFPPAFTIFRRRSLRESSLTAPTRAHPEVRPGSVVRRTWAIKLRSGSCAQALETETSTARHVALTMPIGEGPYVARVTGPEGYFESGGIWTQPAERNVQ